MTLVLCIFGFYIAGACITYTAIAMALLSEPPGASEADVRPEAGVPSTAVSSLQM